MRTINPSAKLIGLTVMTMVLAAVHNPILNYLIFLIASVLCIDDLIRSHRKVHLFLYPMIPIGLLAVGMFFTGFRFTSAPSSVVSSNLISSSSQFRIPGNVWNGMIFSSRMLVYAAIGLLFALTSDPVQMIRSFEKQLHMPQMFAYGLLSAWNLLPHMAGEYRKTKLAFQLRGIRVLPFSPRLLVTLMVKTIRWSEELAMAMESRGFSSREARSSYDPPRIRRRDAVFLVITCAVFPLCSFF
ncbi:MAG: energy-coupling factor transporter transmembrane component T [Bulleidia sp.]